MKLRHFSIHFITCTRYSLRSMMTMIHSLRQNKMRCVSRRRVGSGMRSATHRDDVDAASASSHRFTPRHRRVIRVAVRHNHQVVGHVRPVSVARLEHYGRRIAVKNSPRHACTVQVAVSNKQSLITRSTWRVQPSAKARLTSVAIRIILICDPVAIKI